jgi:LPXTG-motif cell wall-anchored protein
VVHGVRTRFRLTTIGVLTGLGVLAVAGPAAAHVEVSADKTRAGATDVTLTFHGEAENPSGIKSERVVLPEGIAPADVTPVKLPSGWTFTANADGFVVGGKALGSGKDAEWKVKVAKLPEGETRLSFKTLETYADGEVSRWIEIQEGDEEPDNPAPLITLKPGPSTAPATTSPVPADSSAAPVATAAPTAPATIRAEPAANTDEESSTWWVWALVALVVVGGAGFLLMRRRAATPAGE